MSEQTTPHQADPLNRARLRWRARRGLLENDLIIERFFNRYEADLTDADVAALDRLFDLPDNDLLDLFLARKPLVDELAEPTVQHVLDMLRLP